jgi:hypothetical protein
VRRPREAERLVITNFSTTIHLDATATVQHLRMYLFDSSFNPVNQFTVPYNPNVYPGYPISANNPSVTLPMSNSVGTSRPGIGRFFLSTRPVEAWTRPGQINF